MSPELLDPEIQNPRQTKRSDCYALGMVIYEVLSGHVPFPRYSTRVVAARVLRGERPERPQGTEGNLPTAVGEVWEVLERCWKPQPGNRPSIEDVLQCLEKVSRSWVPLSSQLSTIPSTTDSLGSGFSSILTMESSNESEVPSQPSEKPDQEGSAGIVDGVSWMSLLKELRH